ncbi:hypothetical protein RvY_06041 [Ramazzottius varieornatus]|uniref:Uncharacterized protein n=1 Tax=Ramazzottius varieornatus TaxID=947166 RepID=A0A1D1UX74_RAMVA|nr:hypothetical protein RvY_06041 [Ramazzottius varieornatus]
MAQDVHEKRTVVRPNCHDVHKDIVIANSEIAERYVSDTDFGDAVPPLPFTTIVNPADMEIFENDDEPEESDTCEEFDDGDGMDFFAGHD